MPARLNQVKGFTLVELLVVISIIAILSVVGITVFTGVQKGARDARRRADINAITKAFEVKYNTTGSYGDLTPVNNADLFAGGSFPKDPAGADYTVIQNQSSGGFRVCASLGDNPPCAQASDSCFCKTSVQADPPPTTGGSGTTVVTNQDTIAVCPTQGLAGYWKMDEPSWINNCSTTSVMDSSGNGNNGKSCPNGTGPTGGATGKFGNAGSFDGSNDYVDLGQSNSLKFKNTDSFTISTWANIAGPAGSVDPNPSNWIVNIAYACTAGAINLVADPNRPPSMWVRDDAGNSISVSGTTTISTNVWYLITSVRDVATDKIYIYVNGKLEGSTADTTTANLYSGTVANYIGRRYPCGNANYLNGKIDEVRIYNRALSNTEVAQLYNNGQYCIQ